MAYDEGKFLAQAHPIFKVAVEHVLADLRAGGWQPRIVHIKRSAAQQAEKVKKGHSKTMKSWHLDTTVGLLPQSPGEYDVVQGNAADIVDSRYGWSGPAAKLDFAFWQDLGRVAKKYGCSWGGDWKTFKDVAHIQMLFIEMPPQRAGHA